MLIFQVIAWSALLVLWTWAWLAIIQYGDEKRAQAKQTQGADRPV